MENNNDVAIIRKWYDVKTGLYVRDWTAEEYKRLSLDEHILQEYDDGNLIECYCKETRTMKVSLQSRIADTRNYYDVPPTDDRYYRYRTFQAWTPIEPFQRGTYTYGSVSAYRSTADRT